MHKLKVLIVDDEVGMREGAERSLYAHQVPLEEFSDTVSFELRSADTGTAAVGLIGEWRPDILLLDYKLPDMTGLDVLEAAEGAREAQVIMITAFASLEVAVAATKRGAFDFLAKPFTPEELREVVWKAARHVYLHRKAKKLEEEKKRMRFEFVSVLAHELKSPLAAVEGYLNLIKERLKGPDLGSYDQMIERSILRMGGMRKLVLDLLDLTRLESDTKKRVIEIVDLAAAAGAAADSVAAPAAARRVAVDLKVAPGLAMSADRGELDMILSNLLSNAVKYNKDGGRVTLEITRPGPGRVLIRCADTGIGMTGKELERLFGEFVRMKNRHTAGIEGTGLGLSIVKKLAALYGGGVKADSVYGEGTVFELTLNDAVVPAETLEA